MIYFISFLCIFNIVCWIVFLKKFKNLFTADDIIAEAKNEMNKIVIDLNNNANRNITIIDDRISKIDSLIKEADKRVKLLMDLEKQGIALSDFKGKLTTSRKNSSTKRAADAYEKNKRSYSGSAKKEEDYDIRSIQLTPSAKSKLKSESSNQAMLFEEEKSVLDTSLEMNITRDGASYAEIPVVTPDVFVREIPISQVETKKESDDFKTKVISLFNSGMTIEKIAKHLTRSTTEVQMVLSIEGLI